MKSFLKKRLQQHYAKMARYHAKQADYFLSKCQKSGDLGPISEEIKDLLRKEAI